MKKLFALILLSFAIPAFADTPKPSKESKKKAQGKKRIELELEKDGVYACKLSDKNAEDLDCIPIEYFIKAFLDRMRETTEM